VRSEQEHCVNAFRNSGGNASFPKKSCTRASTTFLAGIIPWSMDGTTLLGKTMHITSHLHLVCIVQPRCNYTAPHSTRLISEPYSQSERVTLSWIYKRMLAQHEETCANGMKRFRCSSANVGDKGFSTCLTYSATVKQVDSRFCISDHASHPQASLSLYKVGFQTSHLWSTHKQLHHLATELNAW